MNHATAFLMLTIFLSHTLWSQTPPPREAPARPRPGTPVRPTEPVKPDPTPGPVRPVEPVKPDPTPEPVRPVEPVIPKPPPKQSLDRQRLEQVVRSASIDYVQDVLNSVADAYQVRHGIREGMLRAASQVGNYELESVIQNTSEYQSGLASGRTNGKSEGTTAGQRSADSQSHSIAQGEIAAAIDRTLDTGTAIQFKPAPRMVTFTGSSHSLFYPSSIESRWSENDSQKQYQIKRLLRSEPPSEYLRGLFDLTAIYRNHVTRLPSDLDTPAAFRTWFDNDLESHSSSSANGRNFYREITNASLFEMASENGDLFRTAFNRNVDNNSLERQWDRKVTSHHQGAVNLGESMYLKEASDYASERGYYKGYTDVFNDASIVSFNRTFLDYYRQNYSNIENLVRTSSAVTEIQGVVVNEDGKSEVTYGDTFNVVINRIANRGMVAADVDIEIPDQNHVTSFNNKAVVRVNGLTRISQNQLFQRLGWISSITAPDQTITISARIHDTTVSLTAKATYEEMIRKAVRTPSTEMSVYLMSLALKFMKKQYDEMSGFNDQYRNREPAMMLVRVRKLFDTMTEAEKTQLRSHGQLVRNVFGGKPVRFLNPKRDEWDATQAMISEMGLPGTVPSEANNPPGADEGT